MRHLNLNLYLSLVLALLLFAACPGKREIKQVTIYPTYGHETGGNWEIPMRIWVHTPREKTGELLAKAAEDLGNLNELEKNNFHFRITDIAADSRPKQDVRFAFDQDENHGELRIKNKDGKHERSTFSGIIEGTITLSKEQGQNLLEKQDAAGGQLTLRVISPGHKGSGSVRLIKDNGISVISDIDDTIKITEMTAADPKTIVRNTFFNDFRAAPGMAEMYKKMLDSGYEFHYVSGGPYQLFRPLEAYFISGAGNFPNGSFHMKSVSKNLLDIATWKNLYKLIKGEATFNQKVAQVDKIFKHFPNRHFILIGDSGEKDPEVYKEIKNRFGDRVKEIRIRDVGNDSVKNPERLAGMTIIDPANGQIRDPAAGTE